VVENPFRQIRHSIVTEFTARRGPIAERMSPARRVSRRTHTAEPSPGRSQTDSGSRGEPAASLVTEHGQPVHERRIADEVDLLAEVADAVRPPEEQGVLEVPVDGFRVVPSRVEASEVGIAGRDRGMAVPGDATESLMTPRNDAVHRGG
jgi:hypothetical protein